MADEELAGPDLDSMDSAGIAELRDRMSNGEDVTKAKEVPAPKVVEPAGDDEPDDDDIAASAPSGEQARSETVDFKRFDRERIRRKESDSEAKALREENARMSKEFNDLMAKLNGEAQARLPKEPDPDADIDPDIDPIGAIKQFRDRQKREREAQAVEGQKRQETQQRDQRINETLAVAGQQFGAAVKANPQVQTAYDHLVKSFADELTAFGTRKEHVQAKLQGIEKQHILYAMQNNIPIADYIQTLATARGYRLSADPLTIDASANVDQIKQKAASLTSTGGAATRTGSPSPNDLMSMSKADYAKWREKHDVMSAFVRH